MNAAELEAMAPTSTTLPTVVLYVHVLDRVGSAGDLTRALTVCGRQADAASFPCGDLAAWRAELVDGPMRVRVGLCDRHHAEVRTVPTLARLWRVVDPPEASR